MKKKKYFYKGIYLKGNLFVSIFAAIIYGVVAQLVRASDS